MGKVGRPIKRRVKLKAHGATYTERIAEPWQGVCPCYKTRPSSANIGDREVSRKSQ